MCQDSGGEAWARGQKFNLCQGTVRCSRLPFPPLLLACQNLFLEILACRDSSLKQGRVRLKAESQRIKQKCFQQAAVTHCHFLCPAFRTLEARCVQQCPLSTGGTFQDPWWLAQTSHSPFTRLTQPVWLYCAACSAVQKSKPVFCFRTFQTEDCSSEDLGNS